VRADALASAPRERTMTRWSADRIASRLGVVAFARALCGTSTRLRASDMAIETPSNSRRSVRERRARDAR
jgi:hypothetical protein